MADTSDDFEHGKITPGLRNFVKDREFSDFEDTEARSLYHAANSMMRLLLQDFTNRRNRSGEKVETSYGFLATQHLDLGEPDSSEFYLNGAAGKEGNVYCFALDGGIVPYVLDLSDSLLSQPNVLPEIGNPKKEKRQPVFAAQTEPGLRPFFRAYGTDEIRQELANTRFYPYCEVRQECSFEVCVLMLSLLWFHEVAHAVRGHVDFCARSGIPRLRERRAGNENVRLRGASRIALELDADFYAMLMALFMIRKYENPFGMTLGSSHLSSLSFEKQAAVVMVAFTCICHLWDRLDIIENAVLGGDPNSGTTHVIPRQRAAHCQYGFQFALMATLENQRLRTATKAVINRNLERSQRALKDGLDILSWYAHDTEQERYDPRGNWNFYSDSTQIYNMDEQWREATQRLEEYRFS